MALETAEVVVQKLQLHEPPTLKRALLYWLGIFVLELLLHTVVRNLLRRFRIKFGKLNLPALNALRPLSPASVLTRRLRGTTVPYPRTVRWPELLDDLAGHWYIYGLIAIDSATEELVFRGVPLLAALSLGYSQFAAVAIGTLVWAIGHDIDELPATILAGAFYGWLWLSSAWFLAVAFHVFTNCFAHTVGRIAWWTTSGRYPA